MTYTALHPDDSLDRAGFVCRSFHHHHRLGWLVSPSEEMVSHEEWAHAQQVQQAEKARRRAAVRQLRRIKDRHAGMRVGQETGYDHGFQDGGLEWLGEAKGLMIAQAKAHLKVQGAKLGAKIADDLTRIGHDWLGRHGETEVQADKRDGLVRLNVSYAVVEPLRINYAAAFDRHLRSMAA